MNKTPFLESKTNFAPPISHPLAIFQHPGDYFRVESTDHITDVALYRPAEDIDGDTRRFDVFNRVRWFPFPGGRMLREQYCMIGSWWYGMRDAFGI